MAQRDPDLRIVAIEAFAPRFPVMPAMEELNGGWLGGPFLPHDHRSCKLAATFSSVPLEKPACGVAVNEDFSNEYPVIEGRGRV